MSLPTQKNTMSDDERTKLEGLIDEADNELNSAWAYAEGLASIIDGARDVFTKLNKFLEDHPEIDDNDPRYPQLEDLANSVAKFEDRCNLGPEAGQLIMFSLHEFRSDFGH